MITKKLVKTRELVLPVATLVVGSSLRWMMMYGDPRLVTHAVIPVGRQD